MEVKEKTRDYCEIERDLIKAIKSLRRNFDESFLIFSRVYDELMNTKKDDVIKADLYSVNRFSHKITHDAKEYFEKKPQRLKENLQKLIEIIRIRFDGSKQSHSHENSFNLRYLVISGFKIFKQQEIEFKNGVNLIVGNNGVGKTTILDAISLILAQYISPMRPYTLKGAKKLQVPKLENEDIKLGMNDCCINAEFEYNGSILSEKIEKSLFSNEYTNKWRKKGELWSLGEQTNYGYFPSSFPVISYHCISKGNNNANYNEVYDFHKGYVGCLNGRANVKEVKKWLNTEKTYSQDKYSIKLFLDMVNRFLYFIDDPGEIDLDDNRNDYTIMSTRRFYKEMENTFELYYIDDEQKIEFGQMSSGYQQILNMVMDIAYRMIVLDEGNSYPELASGVVLIDEIDLHLHPKWQWNVLTALHKVFPNVQFIVTTHSPFILSSCEECNVIILDHDGVNNVESYGKSIHNIVEHIFGTYTIPEKLSKLYQEFEEYIGNENYEAAETIRDKMKDEYGDANEMVKEASWRLEFCFDDE